MTFRVAYVIDTFNAASGGPPGTVSLMANAGTGHWRAELFTTDHRESPLDRLLVDEFPGSVTLMPAAVLSLVRGLGMLSGLDRRLETALRRGGVPDLVHIHGLWSPFLLAFAHAAARLGIPYIVSPHGMLEPWSLSVHATRKSLALKIYQRGMLARAAAIHATSAMEADNIRRLNLGSVPVVVVPNIVDEPMTGQAQPPQSAPPRVMLFLSRIHEKKGLDLLLEAWNTVRPTGWRLKIVGSGQPQYLAKLQAYCTTHGTPDVEFHPHADGDERERLFREAAVFVLPTYSENFGNVVAEALIRGVPVITTTGTPWVDIVSRQCGWYVPPTAPALCEVVAQATATAPAILEDMGYRGREYARYTFTRGVVREALLGLYRSALNPHPLEHAV